MGYASSVLSSTERSFDPSNSNEPTFSSGKSGLWSGRSAKCLILGGLAASYGCSLGGAMERSAGKAAVLGRFSGGFPTEDVGLEPEGGVLRFQGRAPLLSDTEAATPISSCMQGVIVGGVGSVIARNPLPLLVGLSECLPAANAQQKIGNEFQVNTYTNNSQDRPAVASFSNGNFVVTWGSRGQDGSGLGVYGQLFDSNAVKIGNEFLVNTYISFSQWESSAASFDNDNFIVAWASEGQDGNGNGVYGQLFYSNNSKLGSEFQINTYTDNSQRRPSAAHLNNGNFVVTWESLDQDGDLEGVYGQLFYENATNLGNEFQVNTYTADIQTAPSAASFSNDNFVVTWSSWGQDGSVAGIYGQLFYGNGTKFGNEFQANTYTRDDQQDPSVASFSNGNFVVTWHSWNQDGSDKGVYGQIFDGNGNRVGNEFQVNTHTDLAQWVSSVASFSNDNFIVVWQSGNGQDGDAYGVYGQLFNESAHRVGNEFQVNTYTSNSQRRPAVASFGNGNFVVAWESDGQDGSSWGVYGQLFEGPLITSSTTTTSTTAETTTNSSLSILSSTSNNPTTLSTDITTMVFSSTLSSNGRLDSSTSGTIVNSSSNLIRTTEMSPTSTPMTSATLEHTVTSPPGNSSAVWISLGLIGGILFICLGGGAFYVLQRRKAGEDSSNTDSSLELSGNAKSKDYAQLPKKSVSEDPYANFPNEHTEYTDDYANSPQDPIA